MTIETLHIELNKAKAKLERYEKAMRMIDTLWFDPKSEGACIACDVNLHESCIGVHMQLNGEPCVLQVVHDAINAEVDQDVKNPAGL